MSMPGQEARRQIYEQLAREFCGKFVAVCFVSNPVYFDGTRYYGWARWSGYGHYEILLSDSIPLEHEAGVFAHEVGHVHAEHPIKFAPTYLKNLVANLQRKQGGAPIEKGARAENVADLIGSIVLETWREAGAITW